MHMHLVKTILTRLFCSTLRVHCRLSAPMLCTTIEISLPCNNGGKMTKIAIRTNCNCPTRDPKLHSKHHGAVDTECVWA